MGKDKLNIAAQSLPDDSASDFASDVAKARRFNHVTPNGVAYEQELAGPSGANFRLLREAHHTDVEIEVAMDWIRREQDVVHLRVRAQPS